MKRREFITLLGGAAVAWPVAAHAQQATMSVIGFIDPTSPDTAPHRLAGFRQGLKETGYVEGENLAIVYRFAENQVERLPEQAADLVRRQVAVIVTFANGSMAAKAATTTIPIVFISGEDPVKLGLVASLARPGGNLTGINLLSAELVAKRLELVRELVPGATRVSVLVNPTGPSSETTLRDALSAARAIGLRNPGPQRQYQPRNQCGFHNFSARAAQRPFRRHRPLLHLPGACNWSTWQRIIGLPATYASRQFAEVGGLMSYGSNITDAWHQVGVYTGRILKGSKPADLPVIQATKFELVINAQNRPDTRPRRAGRTARPRRRGNRVKRREFITLLGGAAAAWPLAARAQQRIRNRP